jgi:[acyl-carrier-protein] S-malonyltransferase
MTPVRDRLEALTRTMRWRDPAVPLAANVSGALVTRAEDVRRALVAQVDSEVRWVKCVTSLRRAGATAFLELGAGEVLSGLIRAIDPQATVLPAAVAEGPGALQRSARAA